MNPNRSLTSSKAASRFSGKSGIDISGMRRMHRGSRELFILRCRSFMSLLPRNVKSWRIFFFLFLIRFLSSLNFDKNIWAIWSPVWSVRSAARKRLGLFHITRHIRSQKLNNHLACSSFPLFFSQSRKLYPIARLHSSSKSNATSFPQGSRYSLSNSPSPSSSRLINLTVFGEHLIPARAHPLLTLQLVTFILLFSSFCKNKTYKY